MMETPDESDDKTGDREGHLLALVLEALAVPEPERESFVLGRCGGDGALAASAFKMMSAYGEDDTLDVGGAPGAGSDGPEEVTVGPARRSAEGTSRWDAFLGQLEARGPGHTRYVFKGEIARGGMGVVLRVFDQDVRRPLAMKVILGSDPSGSRGDTPPVDDQTLGRFLEEAQITGQLDHPGIVPVHDVGLDASGQVYFTMKLVKGRTLTEIIELAQVGSEGWTTAQVLSLLLRITDAMSYAHEKGVIHRDLKPANIMVGRFGEVYVMDWGLARIRGRDRAGSSQSARDEEPSVVTHRRDERESDPLDPAVTVDGTIVGTPAYMSPEQARGDQEQIDERTDVYALGSILYHVVAGQAPYADLGRNARVVLDGLLRHPPRALSEVASSVSPALLSICTRAMERDRDRRYPSMRALAEDLRAYLEGRVVHAQRFRPVAYLRSWLRRHPGIAAVSVLSLIALSIQGFISLRKIRAEERRTAELHYIANIAAASRNLELGRTAAARAQLDACDPDLRGFEWRHLALAMDLSIATFPLPEGYVASGPVAVSPAGNTIAFGLDAGGILLFDWTRGEEIERFDAGSGASSLAFSPDGRYLAIGGASVRVRDLKSGEVRVLSEMAAQSIAISRDASHVFWSGRSSDVRPEETEDGGVGSNRWVVYRYLSEGIVEVGETDGVVSLSTSWDGEMLLASGKSGVYASTSTAQGLESLGKTFCAPATLLPDGQILACDESHQRVLLARTDGAWTLKMRFAAARSRGTGKVVATATPNGELRVFAPQGNDLVLASPSLPWKSRPGDVVTMEEQLLRGHTDKIVRLELGGDGGVALTTSKDGTFRVWGSTSSLHRIVIEGPLDLLDLDRSVEQVRFEADGRLITWDKTSCMRWDAESMVRVGLRWCNSSDQVRILGPGGVAGIERDGVGYLLYSDVMGLPDVVLPKSSVTRGIALSPDRRRVAVLIDTEEKTAELCVYEVGVEEPQRLRLIAKQAGAMAFVGSDRVIVPMKDDDPVSVTLGEKGGVESLTGEGWHETQGVMASFDGRWLVGGANGSTWARDLKRSGAPVVLRDYDPDKSALDVSVEGRVAVGYRDGTVRLWDASNGECVAVFVGHSGAVRSVSFSPDGKRLASCGDKLIVWESDPEVARRRQRIQAALPWLKNRVDRALEDVVFPEDLRAESPRWDVSMSADEREVAASLAELTSWAPDFEPIFLIFSSVVPKFDDLERAHQAAIKLAGPERSRIADEGAARAIVAAHRHFPTPTIKVLLALAQYRLGRFDLALGRLQQASATGSPVPDPAAATWTPETLVDKAFDAELSPEVLPLCRAVEAMTRYRMGEHERARQIIATVDGVDADVYPLIAEARALIHP